MSLFREDLLDRADARAQAQPKPGAHTILIVDDEVGNLRVLRSMLGGDYRVLEAADGAEALQLLVGLAPEDRPSVVLSDQRMPRMTGVELFEQLREQLPATLRIIITGFVDVGAIVDAINRAGIYKFVVKPYDHHDLKLTVERAVEAFELRRQVDRHVAELEERVRERTRALEAINEELRQANAAIERASLTDPLTGLGNRRAVTSALQARTAAPMATARSALLVVDVDHFKAVNDRHGHDAGDTVLRNIAEALRAQCREGEFAARWGGEEFLLALVVADERDALSRAQQLRLAVDALHHGIGNGTELRATCSIGVACWPFDPTEPGRLTWEQVLSLADGALYLAKHGGRNAAVCLASGDRLPEAAEFALAQRLPELLDGGSVRMQGGS